MSGLSISVRDTGVVEELNRLHSVLTDMRPVFEEIGHGWRSFADLCFREESDPWGQAWEQLSEVTLSRRRGTSAQILRDTERLASSITYSATSKSLKLGTDVIYGAAQFLGMKKGYAGTMRNGRPIPWGDIPPRPALPIRPGGKVDLPDSWRDFAMEVIRDRLAGAK